jgi:hypothetical protein
MRTLRWQGRRRSMDGIGRRAWCCFGCIYLGLAPYENARHFLGLSERSWVNWTEEVRHHCGKELLRRGMFPLRKYFSSIE